MPEVHQIFGWCKNKLVFSISHINKKDFWVFHSYISQKQHFFVWKSAQHFFGQKLWKTKVTTLFGDQFLVYKQKSEDGPLFFSRYLIKWLLTKENLILFPGSNHWTCRTNESGFRDFLRGPTFEPNPNSGNRKCHWRPRFDGQTGWIMPPYALPNDVVCG